MGLLGARVGVVAQDHYSKTLVYRTADDEIRVAACRYHYEG
jgi:Txe/YoeB family toxin of Txe-Axe toxin-antitoxin module